MEQLSPLEQAVLRLGLAGDHAALAALREQLSGSSVRKRERTGVGFFTEFEVPKELAPVPLRTEETWIGDVHATMKGLRHGAGFVIHVKNGYLTMLEGYSYDEPWPETEEEFSVYYHPEPRNLTHLRI